MTTAQETYRACLKAAGHRFKIPGHVPPGHVAMHIARAVAVGLARVSDEKFARILGRPHTEILESLRLAEQHTADVAAVRLAVQESSLTQKADQILADMQRALTETPEPVRDRWLTIAAQYETFIGSFRTAQK